MINNGSLELVIMLNKLDCEINIIIIMHLN
jgi:hypothetical protein